MKRTIITCDGCGASTSESMRPDGWACLHVFLYDSEGEPKFSGTEDRCARCMGNFLTPSDRSERPTLPDNERADIQCRTTFRGTRCELPIGHVDAHDFDD